MVEKAETLIVLDCVMIWYPTYKRKVGYGRGAGRLVSTTHGPVVSAPGSLVAGPGPLAAGPDSVFNDATEVNTINAVPVKLPELWQSKVRSWFA